MTNNNENLVGKTVEIHAPFGGRKLDEFKIEEVRGENNNVLVGTSLLTNTETAYYLDDGINVKVIE